MDKLQLLNLLIGREPEAIIRSLAMMAYNPAIGRVLEAGGVDKFSDLMVETIPKFYGYVTRDHFETIYAETCERILVSFKTNRGESLSYGQAQKPLNVFLKVYVDWANRPDQGLAEKLIPLLHVPLDSLLMQFIAREFLHEYQTQIVPLRKRLAELIAERMEKTTPRMVERAFGTEFSLTELTRRFIWRGRIFFARFIPANLWHSTSSGSVLERSKMRGKTSLSQ